MKTIYRIARTELRTLFYSPIAWFLLIAFFVQSSLAYMGALKYFAIEQERGGEYSHYLKFLTINAFPGQGGLLTAVVSNLYLYIPLLTMSLLSRETSSGTIKLLYSSPIKVSQIVFGKFLSMVVYSLLLLAIIAVFMVSAIFQIKNADSGLLLSGFLGLFLLLCTFSAIGLFMSSLTTYQVVAALSTFVMIAALSFIGTVWQKYDFFRDVTYYLSLSGRSNYMLNGLISSKDLIYFLSIIYMFIGITVYKLKSAVESKSFFTRASRYTAIIISGILIIYVSSRPVFTTYWDLTTDQIQTLTPNAQKIVRDLGDDLLEVTVYNNLLDYNANLGLPESRNNFLNLWEQYLRFKPNISFKFVQYYAEPLDGHEPFAKSYPGKTLKQIAKENARAFQSDLQDFESPEQLQKVIDLRPENYRFVMQLKYKGRTTFLRLFDDGTIWPSQAEISAAFKRLLQASIPKIVFLTGNLERSINKLSEREYNTIVHKKTFRYSLINQGFDTDTLSLEKEDIPAGITAVVLADPKTELSKSSLEKLQRYIDNGGNLLIAGEPGKQGLLNHILEKLGVHLMDKNIVQPSDKFAPDLVLPYITTFGGSTTGSIKIAANDSLPVAMPGVTGLLYSPASAFAIRPLLVTDSFKSWIKEGNLVLDSANVVFNPAMGDKKSSVPTMLALSRKINGREQHIVVSGDADFMSNSAISRDNLETANFVFINALFSWLSDGRFPIDTSRPKSKDNRVNVSIDQIGIISFIYVWVIPGILLAFGSVLLIRRKRK